MVDFPPVSFVNPGSSYVKYLSNNSQQKKKPLEIFAYLNIPNDGTRISYMNARNTTNTKPSSSNSNPCGGSTMFTA